MEVVLVVLWYVAVAAGIGFGVSALFVWWVWVTNRQLFADDFDSIYPTLLAMTMLFWISIGAYLVRLALVNATS